ncbi:MAG: acyl-CoA dehydrogenase family protein [Flavobacteriales bacterium]|nr:acyl-CoA dehydrogenase family protein [Flavobacteriales bacterium]
MSETVKPKVKSRVNRVLDAGARVSKDFFESDLIFQEMLSEELSKSANHHVGETLSALGKNAAGRMNPLSLDADKNGPELVKRNGLGEDINEIKFHPAYWELLEIAVESEMFRVKWEPKLREQFITERNRMGFASGFLYCMSEMGQYCPLCMTDGVARLIDLHCAPEDKERLMPHIYTKNVNELMTGAMFLTEKTGGSDVGANLVSATPIGNGMYHLNGEKWFCSNVNGDIIFVLARTDQNVPGIRGISIFLVEKYLEDGTKNPIEIIRLKDKLGVRSMASAECILTNTVGKLIGAEFQGFTVMADMVNLSRIYTAMGSLAGSRRAIIEAYQFINHRQSFGKPTMEHALVREKFREIGSMYVANFYMVWRTIRALDNAENGDTNAEHLLRLLTPMIKKSISEEGVYIAREGMELMGGVGYIEDLVMPKIIRDLMVNPIWEGAGNIMILDMLRASKKSNGLEIIRTEIVASLNDTDNCDELLSVLDQLYSILANFQSMEQDKMESTAKPVFEKLTLMYKLSVLHQQLNEKTQGWVQPAIEFFTDKILTTTVQTKTPLSRDEVDALIAWKY